MAASGRNRRVTGRRAALVLSAAVLVATVVACRPLPLGGASNILGNDPVDCAQFQPVPSEPCGPQPMVWAAINAPYERFDNGDPYATKCARNNTGTLNASTCSGPYNGAQNQLYDPTGYEYAIDVGADDVGTPLTFEVYDAGTYPRSTGTPVTLTMTGTEGGTNLVRSSGSVTFTSSDLGKLVSGAGIPAGARVEAVVSTSTITVSSPLTSSGSRTVTVAPDCSTNAPPFNASPYSGFVGTQNCQTGDVGSARTQFQVFENDGNAVTIDYDQPIDGCHLYLPPNTGASVYKNAWAPVCTFTPTMAGIYPFRIKTSGITLPDGTVVTDAGNGYNDMALRVTGGASTRLYATGALSIYTNVAGSDARFYLAEITTADAGRRLQVDVYDPGDGASGSATVQVLAPPSGAPGLVPTSGTVLPAAGYADSCRYNDFPSQTRGPDVSEPLGQVAEGCAVMTRSASANPANKYNNHWLRIEIDIAEDYACETDCWWTVRYVYTGATTPSDRVVWAPTVSDRPAPPPTTTTTTTESTTTTTESTTTTVE